MTSAMLLNRLGIVHYLYSTMFCLLLRDPFMENLWFTKHFYSSRCFVVWGGFLYLRECESHNEAGVESSVNGRKRKCWVNMTDEPLKRREIGNTREKLLKRINITANSNECIFLLGANLKFHSKN